MTHLSPGQVVHIRDSKFTVARLLGSGMTAQVYLVQDAEGHPWALKYLHPEATSDIRALFHREIENLLRAQKAWEEIQQEDSDLAQLARRVPLPAPRFRVASDQAIVMEYIPGRSAEEYFREIRERTGEKVEYYGLTLALQLGLLLWALHEKAGRCYSDMKIGNLLLVPSSSPEFPFILKVIDWSVLNEKAPTWVQNDLFLASLIVYQLLTGESLPRSHLRVTIPIGQVPGFAELSSGTQGFLRRALSPVMRVRYATAREWTERVLELWHYWAWPPERLYRHLEDHYHEIRALVDRLRRLDLGRQSPEEVRRQALRVQKFAEAYFVAETRIENVPEEWALIYQEYVSELQPLDIGLRALQGLSFELAKEQFDRGAALFPEERERYAHWWVVADGGQHMDQSDFRRFRDTLLDGVKALTENQWEVAYERLLPVAAFFLGKVLNEDELPSFTRDPYAILQRWYGQELPEPLHNGLFWIFLEVLGVRRQREAEEAFQRGAYHEARKYAHEARQILRWLPKGEHFIWFLLENELAEIEERARAVMQASAREQSLERKFQQALSQRNWQEVYEALRELWEFPQRREVTQEQWRQAIDAALQEGNLQGLRILLDGLRLVLSLGGRTFPSDLEQLDEKVVFPLLSLEAIWQREQDWPALWEAARGHWQVLQEANQLPDLRAKSLGLVRREARKWVEHVGELLASYRPTEEENFRDHWSSGLEFLAVVQQIDASLGAAFSARLKQVWAAWIEEAVRRREWAHLRILVETGRDLSSADVWKPIYRDALRQGLLPLYEILHEEIQLWDVLSPLVRLQPERYKMLLRETLYSFQSIEGLLLRLMSILPEENRTNFRRLLDQVQARIRVLRSPIQVQRERLWAALERFAEAILHGDLPADWLQVLDWVAALQALGEKRIPDGYEALRKYVREVIGNGAALSEDTDELERLRDRLLRYYLTHKTPAEIFSSLETWAFQGKWEQVYVNATRLLRWLEPGDATWQHQVAQEREQARQVLEFLAWAETWRANLGSQIQRTSV